MTTMVILLLVAMFIGFCWINTRLNKEIKRNRMHQAFTAGIIRAVTDYRSKTDDIDEFELPERVEQLPIPYGIMLENIDWELSKDLLMANYEQWLLNDRNIFFDEKRYGGDGFNFMYLDLFDKKLREWHSNELMTSRMKEWLSEEVTVTKENVGELTGEIGMLRDLMRGKLSQSGFTNENIDQKFSIMFSHIHPSKLEEAKKQVIRKQ